MLAYQVRFNFRVPETEIRYWKIYQGIIRYTGTKDALRVFYTITGGSIFLALSNPVFYQFSGIYLVPFSIIIIDYFTSVFTLTAFRILVKSIYQELKNPSRDKEEIIIYGAGESGLITKRALDRDAGTRYKVIAFIDDDPSKKGKTVEGIKIYHSDELENILSVNQVFNMILSIQNISPVKKQNIIEKCLSYDVRILNVPPVTSWINGELSFKQIKKIKIEELLEREPIRLDTELIRQQLSGKTILITGGAGSIGSEIARQLITFRPKYLVIVDQAESALYDLELELNEKFRWKNYETVLGDIRQYERMERVFQAFHPEVVFHAAAYKHVPIMENNPSEAILTNVEGTKTIADLSRKYNVEKFVMISTDKAVNPT
jgi:FlaA1/EpsC-like NDP-sugar epimerase